MRRALLAAASLAIAAAASAQTATPTLPTSDVSVVYQPEGAAREAIPGGTRGTIRVRWSARLQRLRVDAEGRTQALLVDLSARSVKVVDSGLHSAMALPVRAGDLDPLTLRDARLTRRGRALVAGRSCTNYVVEESRGRGTICLTDDGIPLRAVGVVDGRAGSFTAISVAVMRQEPALFEVPPGYMQLALPDLRGLRGLRLP